MERFNLSGKRALVTGGSRGIGLALARGLAEAGADLVLLARQREQLAAAQCELAALGRSVETVPFDLEDVAGIAAMYSALCARSGPIDILINNAGVTRRGPAEGIALDDWNTVLQTNLTAIFALSQAFARERIAARQPGRIISLASLMSEAVRRNNAPYAAAKGGIRQLTKALAADWAPYQITVNAIGPGYIQTELTSALQQDPQFDTWVRNRTPLGRWGTPADLAGAAIFLASPAADFITGQTIYVDGGWLATF